jgi:hypothetical protein
MNPKNLLSMLSELAMLKYFPANNEAVLLGLCRLMVEMCNNEQEVRWLIDRMTSGIYAEWPGPQEMRAVLCQRYKPRDGITAYSSVYPDGLPPLPDSAMLMIAMPDLKALPPGHTVSVDVKIESAVHIAARTNEVLRGMGGPATPAEIAAAPHWLRKLEGLE